MANVWIKPTVVAKTALGLLQRELVLPRLVTTDYSVEFTGKIGDTVNVRLPARAVAREYGWRNNRSSTIVVDDLTEVSIPVQLNHDIYHAAGMTDEELSLDIEDFGAQVLQPQMAAVALKLEDNLATTMTAAAYPNTLSLADFDSPYKMALRARKLLNLANVPSGDRILLLGADLDEDFLGDDQLARVDASGSDSALREARIGRIAGFDSYVSNGLPAGVGFAYHRSAYILSTRTPDVPAGATAGAKESYGGIAMRALRDYDANHLQDRSIVSTFMGSNIVADGPDGSDVDTNPDFVRSVKLTS